MLQLSSAAICHGYLPQLSSTDIFHSYPPQLSATAICAHCATTVSAAICPSYRPQLTATDVRSYLYTYLPQLAATDVWSYSSSFSRVPLQGRRGRSCPSPQATPTTLLMQVLRVTKTPAPNSLQGQTFALFEMRSISPFTTVLCTC